MLVLLIYLRRERNQYSCNFALPVFVGKYKPILLKYSSLTLLNTKPQKVVFSFFLNKKAWNKKHWLSVPSFASWKIQSKSILFWKLKAKSLREVTDKSIPPLTLLPHKGLHTSGNIYFIFCTFKTIYFKPRVFYIGASFNLRLYENKIAVYKAMQNALFKKFTLVWLQIKSLSESSQWDIIF